MYGFRLPEDFLIGTANSAFQSEGAWDRDGKSPSIMDYFAEKYAGDYPPGRKAAAQINGRTGTNAEDLPDRGCFFYDHYEEFIEDMKETGQNVYRLSISWPRVMPNGTGEVNPKGIAFYNKVIDKLLSCGITPFVDLYHWDLPLCLYEQGGFENPAFPLWFEEYAKVCFEAFGDRVKFWSTFNETQISIRAGYQEGRFPPYIMDKKRANRAGHYVLLAHFRAVRLYRSLNQGGQIGIVNCFAPTAPAELNDEDYGAVVRDMKTQLEWWMEPLVKGHYPQQLLDYSVEMRESMPEGYQADLDQWFAPMDFMGINYYIFGRTQFDPDGALGFKGAQSFYSEPGQQYAPYPAGLIDAVQYVSALYPELDLYITENGCCLANINDEEAECDDPRRITYLREHLRSVVRCIRAGYRLKGYFYWNDSDSYEIQDGYRLRFGLTWVDHQTGRRRWKKSRHYFSKICKTRMID